MKWYWASVKYIVKQRESFANVHIDYTVDFFRY